MATMVRYESEGDVNAPRQRTTTKVAMNIGIIGLPQTGKKKLFELLVNRDIGTHDRGQTVRGVAEIEDRRFDKVVEVCRPRKATRARLDVLLPPRIEEGTITQGDIFRNLAEVEVFCHVVRAFENDAVYHVSGSVDPLRDIDFVNTEFILHDLVFIEKRLQRLGKDLMKRKDKAGEHEKETLLRLKAALDKETPLRILTLSDEEDKVIRNYPLLSRREMIIVLNVSESDIADTSRLVELSERYAPARIRFTQIAASTEAEVAALESRAEREEFMREIGIEDTALHILTGECIEALGLLSFFTAAPNEARHWFVRRGAAAVEAAGKIHSDLARGFIRAEVIKLNDLVEFGSEEKIRSAGKLAVKGRDYVVEDGDILFIRFNV